MSISTPNVSQSKGPSLARWQQFGFLVLVAAMAIEIFWGHTLNTAELRLSDVYMRHHAHEYRPDPDIVVIDIDDTSTVEMQEVAGLWAWPREVHGDLLEALGEFQPRAVVFDMTFTERDTKHPKSDAVLSDAIAHSPVYLAATKLDESSKFKSTSLAQVAPAFGLTTPTHADSVAPLQLPEAIDPKAWRLGLINTIDDNDGVLRRYRIYTDTSGWKLPSLPARVVADLGYNLPQGSDFVLRWPENGRKTLRYSALYKQLTEGRQQLSEHDLDLIRQALHDKIVIIGSSATSAFDHHLSPLGARYIGVDILALAIDNLKNGRDVKRVGPPWIFLLGLCFMSLQVLLAVRRAHPMMAGLLLLTLSAGSIYAADLAMSHDVLLPIVSPLLFAWLWFLITGLAGYLRERRKRGEAVALFQRFLNPAVVNKIIEQGETVESLSGQTREITVLFSDIRGFTSMSESRSPQEVVNILNRYFDKQVEVVFRHGGTLDKFIGDCIMAFWGAPTDDPQQAQNAVAAALEMEEVLLDFKRDLLALDASLTDFDIGIGVHTGPAVVGFIGAQRKLDYTAIGDTVNLASRVEGLTKGVARILVTAETRRACAASEEFDFAARGDFAVKGRLTEVELYAPSRKRK